MPFTGSMFCSFTTPLANLNCNIHKCYHIRKKGILFLNLENQFGHMFGPFDQLEKLPSAANGWALKARFFLNFLEDFWGIFF